MVNENLAVGRAIGTPPPRPGALRETIYRNSVSCAAHTFSAADDGRTFADVFDLYLANTVIHTWDLASAIQIGLDTPAPYIVDIALGSMRRIPPGERGPGKAYADIPDFPAQSAIDELIVLSGRDPAWRARPMQPQ